MKNSEKKIKQENWIHGWLMSIWEKRRKEKHRKKPKKG